MTPNKQECEIKLKKLFGFNTFYDDQWRTIEKILQKNRVLLVEKTGFGKSLTFQFPATQFEGLTIIFSPLIALMRDQIKSLNKKNISVGLINSEQTEEENNLTLQQAINNELKILYIAPERQENSIWQKAVSKMSISFVVIDEAHCISSWGHDFRPAFRRIINLTKALPTDIPVLATTATATISVAKDIKKQIGGNIEEIRGDLLRKNLKLNIIHLSSEEEKMAWLANYLTNTNGNGIVYTGTRSNAEIFSKWCESEKLNTIYYHAGLDSDSRKQVENEWMENKYKAIISTNALGMGIDKSDIRFIIHTQIPQSPIHYYQEIGRAGRDDKTAEIFLLFNPENIDLPTSFINNARPSIEKYERVINALKKEPLGERNLMKATNLKQTQVRTIKADLLDQNIIKLAMYGRSKKYDYQHNAPQLDPTAFNKLREHRLKELNEIVRYTNIKSCKMLFLCNYLGDLNSNDCGICDSCLNKKNAFILNANYKDKIKKFQADFFPVLKVETTRSNLINGVASSYYGFSNVGAIIHKCKYENGGDYPSFLLKQTLRAFGKSFKNQSFDLVLYVPPTKSGKLVENFAKKMSSTLKIPIATLIKVRETQEQKIFQNGALKTQNIKDAFDINVDIIEKSILLIDDIFDSGATIKEIGKMLSTKGAKIIAPLVIAKTVGGDIAN